MALLPLRNRECSKSGSRAQRQVKFKAGGGNSLAVQWLGLSTFTALAQVQSLVRELRSHKLLCVAKNKCINFKKNFFKAGDGYDASLLP